MKKFKRETLNYKSKKGVTLTVLVVTIAVLLILAGITISAVFGDEGIINKSKETKNNINNGINSNLTKLNELIDDLNGEIDSNGGSTGGNTEEPAKPEKPTTPASPTEDTAPYYPDTTFTKVDGTDLDNGLVIEDAIGNQYVWIEVPKSLYNDEAYNKETTAGDKKPANSEEYDKIEYCLHKYTNYYRKGTSYTDTYYSDDVTGLTETQYNDLKHKMLKSIYENGGFYVGRYEAGIETNRTASGTPTVAPISKAGTVDEPVYPYTYVTCSQAQTLASQLSTGKSYTTSLMFGVQWDLVLKHIEVKEVEKGTALATIQSDLRTDSSSWGNYYNANFEINRGRYAKYNKLSTWYNYNTALANCVTYANATSTKVQATSSSNGILLTTGASDACKKMNIYDLAGNVQEWTLEYAASTSTSDPGAVRGGRYDIKGGSPASHRFYTRATYCRDFFGFRLSLYR